MSQSPTALLLRTRQRAAMNRWSMAPASTRRAIILALGVTTLILLAAGHMMAPRLLIPPIETMTPTGFESRAKQVAGQTAVELAFWMSAFIGAIFSFRVMELLFRRPDIRTIDKLPLPMRALFIDRLVVGTLEAIAWGASASLFFTPLAWNGSPWGAIVCVLLLILGPLTTLGIGIGVQLFVGGAEFGSHDAPPEAQRSADGYGGAGQFFIFAPGAALAASVVAVMLLKLGLQEALRLQTFNRATATGVGLSLGISLICLAGGWRSFSKHYFKMLAGFREADFVGFTAIMDYQQSAFDVPTRMETMLPEPSRGIYRRHVLQYGRRFALTRYAYPIIWLLLGVAALNFSQAALPPWAAAATPLLLFGLLLDPWSRLRSPGIATMPSQALPISTRAERAADALFATRETVIFLLPCVLILLASDFFELRVVSLQSLAPATALLLAGCLTAIAQRQLARFVEAPSRVFITLVNLLPAILLGLLASLSLALALQLLAPLTLLALASLLFKPSEPHAAEAR